MRHLVLIVFLAAPALAQQGRFFTQPGRNPMGGETLRASAPAVVPEGCSQGLTDDVVVEVIGDDVCVTEAPVLACTAGQRCLSLALDVNVATEDRKPRRVQLRSEQPVVAGYCNGNRQLWRPVYRGCTKNDGWLNPNSTLLDVVPSSGTTVRFTFSYRDQPATAGPAKNGNNAATSAPPVVAANTSPPPVVTANTDPSAPPVVSTPPRATKKERALLPDRRKGFHPGFGATFLAGGISSLFVLGGSLDAHFEYSFGLLGLRASPRVLFEVAWDRWLAIGGTLDAAAHLNLGRVFTIRAGAAVGVLPTSRNNILYVSLTGGLVWKFGPASNIQLGLGFEYPVTGQPLIVGLSLAYLFELGPQPPANPTEPSP